MRVVLCIVISLLASFANAQLQDETIRDLKSGRLRDDSSYIYSLPYENGKSCLLIQAVNSSFSHKGELSYDFKMKAGSKVCAAREGVVVSARSDSEKGGLKQENLSDGNFIVVMHADSSTSHYWHLQHNGVLVSPGSSVTKGQVIGLSGNTGYSAFPHLHFQVFDKNGNEILVRFATKKGPRYLRPGSWYRAVAL